MHTYRYCTIRKMSGGFQIKQLCRSSCRKFTISFDYLNLGVPQFEKRPFLRGFKRPFPAHAGALNQEERCLAAIVGNPPPFSWGIFNDSNVWSCFLMTVSWTSGCSVVTLYKYIYEPGPQTPTPPQWYPPPPLLTPPTPPKPSICMLFAHIHTHIHIYTPLSTPPTSHLYVICSTWEPRPRQRTLSTCIFLS